MDDRLVVAAALGAAATALWAGRIPSALLVMVLTMAAAGGIGSTACSGVLRRHLADDCGERPGGARRASPWPGAAIALALVSLVGLRAQQDLAGLQHPLPARLDATGELGSDPEPLPWGARVELVLDGRRYTAMLDRRTEPPVRGLRSGDRVRVEAEVDPLDRAPRGWVLARHLSGRLRVGRIEPADGTRLWFGAANAVHEVLGRGAASMSEEHRALYLGLVVGDDRGQDEITRFRFRASGLTHLLAVSGQNVAFLLAVVAPLSMRLTFRWRWVLGVAAVVSFVLVTRAEPSVLRAAVMAGLALTAAATGRTAPGVRVLAMAMVLLLLGDPMLVHSVGFRLSVAATLGLVVLTRTLQHRLPGPLWLRTPLAVTLAAQAGALPVMALTFGPTSAVAVPANLLAEPAAGGVMMLGITEGLVAGQVREELASVLQVPVRAMVWWIDAVATASARLAVPPSAFVAWAVLLTGMASAIRLWRIRGAPALGRVALLAVVPCCLVLRPPQPQVGPTVRLDGPADLYADCRSWVVAFTGPAGSTEEEAAGVLEELWRMGITRAVRVESAEGGRAAELLAAELRAPLVVSPRVPPRARGSPCSLAP